jgi:hypothetical protein
MYMSNTSERQKIDGLNTLVGPYYGDIYATAVNVHPAFKALRDSPIYFNHQGIHAGGRNEDGELSIHVGIGKTSLTARIQSRLVERFDLPESILSLPDNQLILAPFVFAHELGHVVQADQHFKKYYGADFNPYQPSPDEDYAGYARSDSEANADFIGALVIGNASLGIEAGFSAPEFSPQQWREWTADHPIERTIAAFAMQSV